MTSTSDDRSVRFWDLNFEQKVDWKFCQIKKSKSLFGHTARIFRSKIIEDGKFFFWDFFYVSVDKSSLFWFRCRRIRFGFVFYGFSLPFRIVSPMG